MTHDSKNPTPASPSSELWARAREDYLSGLSAPVVAERHGLSLRTLRRRAAMEGWRRTDRTDVEIGDTPPWNAGCLTREEAIERFPELAEVDRARSDDVFDLLFDPDQAHLRLFAFRQAAEAAALSRPAEAVVWMRLFQSLDRASDTIDRDRRPFRRQDYIRASHISRINVDSAFGSSSDEE